MSDAVRKKMREALRRQSLMMDAWAIGMLPVDLRPSKPKIRDVEIEVVGPRELEAPKERAD